MAVRLLLGDATRVLCSEELQRDSLWTTAAHAQLASVGKILAKTESEAEKTINPMSELNNKTKHELEIKNNE